MVDGNEEREIIKEEDFPSLALNYNWGRGGGARFPLVGAVWVANSPLQCEVRVILEVSTLFEGVFIFLMFARRPDSVSVARFEAWANFWMAKIG